MINKLTVTVPLLIVSFISLTIELFAQEKICINKAKNIFFESSNLPIIIIDTFGKQIENYQRIIVDMGIIDNGNNKYNFITDQNNY